MIMAILLQVYGQDHQVSKSVLPPHPDVFGYFVGIEGTVIQF